MTTKEAQLAAFKRHEMTKKLREAWTQQQQMKDNQKKVDSIFYWSNQDSEVLNFSL